MQRECSAAFTWRLMDFSTADGREGGGGGRIGPATVHLANLVALQHNLRAEYRAAGKSLPGTAEQTGALVQALSESIILGRTTPVHASALQQLQWSYCESLKQMLCATHGMRFHVSAYTFRSPTDAQAAESWQLMEAGSLSRKTFFSLLSLKRPRPSNHFVFPFLTDSSAALWPSWSLCPWAEYIVGRETHHSQQLFQKADWHAAFPPGQSYFHRHMQRKNTAPVAKTILLSLHVPKFSHFSSFSLNAPFCTAHPWTLISKVPRRLQRIDGYLSELHKRQLRAEMCCYLY